MTLLIPTESHGEIESGYLSSFMQFSRLGRYCFLTENMCSLGKYLADNDSVYESALLAYDIDVFWKEFNRHMYQMIESHVQEIPDDRVSIEYMMRLNDMGSLLEVKVSEDEKEISIEDYVLRNYDFNSFITYLSMGGFYGWEESPKYAIETLDSIRDSERNLFN